MTGIDVYQRALALLGYLNTNYATGNKDNLLKRALDILNQVCLDLKMSTLNRLSDKIEGSDIQIDALCYGVGMITALIEGDGVKNDLFTKIYNQKRAAALSKIEKIGDKLPTTSDGVD